MEHLNSGIYAIRNVKTDKLYIGSAKQFSTRWNRHLRDLRNSRHSSIKLQRSFEKHGEDAFEFGIIECVPYEKETIVGREQWWMNAFDTRANGYNIGMASFGDTLTHHPARENIISQRRESLRRMLGKTTKDQRARTYGLAGEKNGMFGKNHSDEAKQKISAANQGHSHNRGWVMSDEQKGQISISASQRVGSKNPFFGRHHSDETKARLSQNESWIKGLSPEEIPYTKQYKIIYADGSDVILFGLKAVSSVLGVSIAAVHGLISRNGTTKKGPIKGARVELL